MSKEPLSDNAAHCWTPSVSLIYQLQHLREEERRLAQLFPKLRYQPELRASFLEELAAVRKQAEILNSRFL